MLSDVPLFNKFLWLVPGIQRLDDLARQANAQSPIGVFLLLMFNLAALGFLGSYFINESHLVSTVIAVGMGSVPFLFLAWKKKKRIEKFQQQLPEGLELIARALRAGHAFTNGMKLAANEFSEPLGPEFSEALDEINFGVSIAEALKNLAGRIDCPELKFFVVAVILQRETGGNLADIIDNLAHIIRERFKLMGKVKVLCSEGKLSAYILISIPFLVVGALCFMNPDYPRTLLTEPVGRIMIYVTLAMMVTGILVMKKMVNIKV